MCISKQLTCFKESFIPVFIIGLKMGQISLVYLIMLCGGATQSVFLLNNLF